LRYIECDHIYTDTLDKFYLHYKLNFFIYSDKNEKYILQLLISVIR